MDAINSTGSIEAHVKHRAINSRQIVAFELEKVFVQEVLKTLDPPSDRDGFSGGIGEEQFRSFLHQQQAEQIMKRGGFGLAKYFSIDGMDSGK